MMPRFAPARMLSIARLALLALVGSTLLAGCGGGTEERSLQSDPASAGSGEVVSATDPCAILSATDVGEVTGSEAGTPELITPVAGGVSYCDWPMAADTSQTIVTVMAIPAPAMTYQEYLDQTRSVLEEGFNEAHYEQVDGLGSAAVWSFGSTLQTWGEGHMVQIQSGVGGPALDRDASAELARRALDGL
jgi:hypothetical protein